MTSIRSIRKRGQTKVRTGIVRRSIEVAIRTLQRRVRLAQLAERFDALPGSVIPCSIDDPRGGVRW